MSRKQAKPSEEQDNPVARFEQALHELEQVVEQLESGEPTLDETLKLYERGMALSRSCRTALEMAEAKIRELSGNGEDADGDGQSDDEDTPF